MDYRSSRGLDRFQLQTLATCEWMRQRQNLILTGATGTGKSWLACAFGQQACRLGIAAYYTTATRLFEELSISRTDGTLAKKRRQLSRLPLLIIDDLGIGGIDPQIGPILLEIFDQQSQEDRGPFRLWHRNCRACAHRNGSLPRKRILPAHQERKDGTHAALLVQPLAPLYARLSRPRGSLAARYGCS